MDDQISLFKKIANETTPVKEAAPLAEVMRPLRIENYVGQDHLLQEGGALLHGLKTGKPHSFILWGPPGSGKTTLARIVAFQSDCEFVSMSAVTSGVKDIKDAVSRAQMVRATQNKGTLLFIDEIHRFNKSQQDALLPHIEDGTLIFVGATTENPSFSLNSALLSRVAVYVLKPLESEHVETILKRALMGKEISEDWIQAIAKASHGDARRALGILERLLQNPTEFSKEAFARVAGHGAILYDRNAEEHYNLISAFIKSMRDSDPDAALYYLARMIEGGEDPLFIARRMVIFASEDIGNADPRALTLAVSVRDAVAQIGMPEGRINLAQGVTYLAVAPKSNASYLGIDQALAMVRETGPLQVPLHLRNAPTKFMKGLGYGSGYQYAHDYDDMTASMSNLPDSIADKKFYNPKDSGLEKQIKARVDELRGRRNKKGGH